VQEKMYRAPMMLSGVVSGASADQKKEFTKDH
jgi:hypothetical protein